MRNRNTARWQRAAVIAPMALIVQAAVGVAHAQPYPPSAPLASASTSVSCDGCDVTTTWSGYKPDSTISFMLFSTPVSLGSTTTNASGTAVETLTIPSGTDPGEHTITGSGVAPDGSPLTQSIHIMVTGPTEQGESTSGELAHTGAELLAPAGIAVAAVGVGTLIVLSIRRRSAASSADR